MYAYVYAYNVVQLLYNIQRPIGCNSINTINCDNDTVRYDNNNSHSTAGLFLPSIKMEQKIDNTSNTAGLLCLPIVMEKKIVNTRTSDVDNNFSFVNYHDRDLDHDTARDNKQRPTY